MDFNNCTSPQLMLERSITPTETEFPSAVAPPAPGICPSTSCPCGFACVGHLHVNPVLPSGMAFPGSWALHAFQTFIPLCSSPCGLAPLPTPVNPRVGRWPTGCFHIWLLGTLLRERPCRLWGDLFPLLSSTRTPRGGLDEARGNAAVHSGCRFTAPRRESPGVPTSPAGGSLPWSSRRV